MKHKMSLARITRCLTLLSLIFVAGLVSAQAQIQPFVDCVELERDAKCATTGKYIAHFGYMSFNGGAQYIPTTSSNNLMSPIRNPPDQTETFYPGVHPRVFAVTINSGATQTWFHTSYYITASYAAGKQCGGDSANSRLMTYQGKLSDGSTAANGIYDLQFQLFNAKTGGAARTTPIAVEDVAVENGIFTVQLDLGVNGTRLDNQEANINLPFNAAIMDGSGGFFEIGVRPGTSTNAFTKLTPRQPLTAVPLAMRANTANDAVRAAFADKGNSGFEVNGDALVSGNLKVTGSITGASKNFKIDHPLEPLNKTLTYTSIESPDMMNIYNGNITTNESGEATITMPNYFEALNKDFRYQLTVIGTFAQAIVLEEIIGNTFKIKTDKPHVKVSWQVTGIRHDKFAEENRPTVEQTKPEAEKNKCLYAPNCQNNKLKEQQQK